MPTPNAQLALEGTYTALVTPFVGPLDAAAIKGTSAATEGDAAPAIDWEAFDALADASIAAGAHLVPCGTTGESPALTAEERRAVITRAVKRAAGRVQVIAGTGSNSTASSIEEARMAEKAGVDAVMVVVPYYNRPSQEGLVRHFVAVARAVRVPVVVYNIPGRTGVDLGPDALARIVEQAPNVVATKEATGNVLRAQELVRRFGDRLTVLSGDDGLTLPMVSVGAKGVISVTSNVLPSAVARATRLALEGNAAAARKAHLALLGVHGAMFCDSNPVPVKAALSLRPPPGVRMSSMVRSPNAPASEQTCAMVVAALDAYRGAEAS